MTRWWRARYRVDLLLRWEIIYVELVHHDLRCRERPVPSYVIWWSETGECVCLRLWRVVHVQTMGKLLRADDEAD